MNLDFTTIPYWGGGERCENNWSGKRRQALSSMLAVLAQDPDSGINYGDADIVHKNESAVVEEKESSPNTFCNGTIFIN